MTTNLRFHAVIGRHIILVVFIAETAVQVGTIALLFLTDAIFETGASGVPSKSPAPVSKIASVKRGRQ